MENKKDEKFEYNDEFCGECGCGVDCEDPQGHDLEDLEFVDMDADDIMYLTLDDDTELECNVLGIFEVEDLEYIALLPMETEEVLLYRYVELEDEEEFELLAIEDEEEFESVSEAFYVLFSDDEDFVEYENYDDLEEDELEEDELEED